MDQEGLVIAVHAILCQELTSFADGELGRERAAAFRLHLRDCEACQATLPETMQLSARLSTLKPRSKDTP